MFKHALIHISVITTQLLAMEFVLSHVLPLISVSLIHIFVGYADGVNLVILLEIDHAYILALMIGSALEDNVFNHVLQEPMQTNTQIFV